MVYGLSPWKPCRKKEGRRREKQESKEPLLPEGKRRRPPLPPLSRFLKRIFSTRTGGNFRSPLLNNQNPCPAPKSFSMESPSPRTIRLHRSFIREGLSGKGRGR